MSRYQVFLYSKTPDSCTACITGQWIEFPIKLAKPGIEYSHENLFLHGHVLGLLGTLPWCLGYLEAISQPLSPESHL